MGRQQSAPLCAAPRSFQSVPARFCQNSGREPYRCMLAGEKQTRSESEGGRREAKITVLATPEPRDLIEPVAGVRGGDGSGVISPDYEPRIISAALAP